VFIWARAKVVRPGCSAVVTGVSADAVGFGRGFASLLAARC